MSFEQFSYDNIIFSLMDSSNARLMVKASFPNRGNYSNLGIMLSPNRKLLLVVTPYRKSFVVFHKKPFRLLFKWESAIQLEKMMLAKWVDNCRVLAGFSWPGDIKMFRIGQKSPLFVWSFPFLELTKIIDFDFSLKRNHAVFSTTNNTVFKMNIQKLHSKANWAVKAKGTWPTFVKVSESGLLVLLVSKKLRVTLLSEKRGEVLSIVESIASPNPGVKRALDDLFLVLPGTSGYRFASIKSHIDPEKEAVIEINGVVKPSN